MITLTGGVGPYPFNVSGGAVDPIVAALDGVAGKIVALTQAIDRQLDNANAIPVHVADNLRHIRDFASAVGRETVQLAQRRDEALQ